MRMWMIPPPMLCNQHLLGEHGEIHKHRHNFEKRHRMGGRVVPKVLIEPANMEARHDELADEMTSRGMNHQSPYTQPDISYLPMLVREAKVSLDRSMHDLTERCPKCAARIARYTIAGE